MAADVHDTRHLRAIDQIGKLHDLRVEAAQAEMARARAELEQALLACNETAAKRDEAQNCWLAGLKARRPDPQHIAIARNWLICREAELNSAQLDEAIARTKRDDAAAVFAERKAVREACEELARMRRRRAVRFREERHSAELADMHLRRRPA